ncbi:MAG: DMT family transporter [Desulfosarcinaceae bacterium]|nr:DMT family transporter [Desulfosarcinaceae bacterium]
MLKNRVHIGVLMVCSAAAMWGFDGVVLTPRLYNLDVAWVVFMLHALPFAGMQVLLFSEYKALRTLTASDLLFFFLVALFGGAIGTLAIVRALFLVQFKHLTVVALLQKLQPIFAILLARILLGERLGRQFLFWTAIALTGGYFLTFETHLPATVNSGHMLPAAGYALLAAFSFGSATVFGKRVLNKVHFRTALFFRYGFTTLIMLFIVAASGKFDQLAVTTPTNWLFFAIIGLTTGSGAILLYYVGLRYIQANLATMCELCFPISTVVFDYLINGNLLSPIQWISAAVMLVAIYRLTQNRAAEVDTCADGGQWCEA